MSTQRPRQLAARLVARVRADTREELSSEQPVRDTALYLVEVVGIWGVINRVVVWLFMSRVLYAVRYSDPDVDDRAYYIREGRLPVADGPSISVSTSLAEVPVDIGGRRWWGVDVVMMVACWTWGVVGYLALSTVPHLFPFVDLLVVVQYLVVAFDPVWTVLAD